MNNESKERKFRIALGIILIVIGPLILIICPIITSSLGYNMLSLSSHIGASEPNFNTISMLIKLWWIGIPITILGTIVGIIQILKKK